MSLRSRYTDLHRHPPGDKERAVVGGPHRPLTTILRIRVITSIDRQNDMVNLNTALNLAKTCVRNVRSKAKLKRGVFRETTRWSVMSVSDVSVRISVPQVEVLESREGPRQLTGRLSKSTMTSAGLLSALKAISDPRPVLLPSGDRASCTDIASRAVCIDPKPRPFLD
jgi:hypothetical protein